METRSLSRSDLDRLARKAQAVIDSNVPASDEDLARAYETVAAVRAELDVRDGATRLFAQRLGGAL